MSGEPEPPHQRRHPRARVNGQAVIRAPGCVVRCELDNVSVGGALLRPTSDSRMDLPDGTPITIDLHLASGSAPWVEQRAHVQRSAAPNLPFAIVFDEVTPQVEQLLEAEVRAALDAERSPRVLVVDRSDERRGRLVATLRRAGCHPLEARTPLEAIEQLETSPLRITAVAIAEILTQTVGNELVCYLETTHPGLRLAIVRDHLDEVSEASGEHVVLEDPDCDRSGPIRQLLDEP